ncbi:hypothetical protein [Providencia phage PSTCR2]|uniref:Uncharacterized protein n=1 Tax=Providencia phage PSTCR2 TaxID=2783544 RepID=A0A873WKN0_9CAUD|nr:hypothetical protein [Providencia phage PSTCR2]
MSKLIVGELYVVTKLTSSKPWVRLGDTIKLLRKERYESHLWLNLATGCEFFMNVTQPSYAGVQWYDEKSAMREVVPEPVSGTNPSLLTVDEFEWRLPAGTFFRVNGKHEPLYLVMSNSHVFNLTEKQMHTTCSSRFKNAQLSVANVQLSEVL